MKLSLLFEHSNLRDMLQLLKYVYMNVARNIQIKRIALTLCCFPTGLKKRTRKAFGIRKKEKDTDST